MLLKTLFLLPPHVFTTLEHIYNKQNLTFQPKKKKKKKTKPLSPPPPPKKKLWRLGFAMVEKLNGVGFPRGVWEINEGGFGKIRFCSEQKEAMAIGVAMCQLGGEELGFCHGSLSF